jgi:L-ascorbate metabolism protein UlaG (beta-lactamase superfamily)
MTGERVRLTLIDGPTLLLEMGGLRILTDPTFDEPQVYSSGPIRIQKFNSPTQSAESLLPINAVLLSHDQHGDNLDISGRAFLPKRRR